MVHFVVMAPKQSFNNEV